MYTARTPLLSLARWRRSELCSQAHAAKKSGCRAARKICGAFFEIRIAHTRGEMI
jgi:hypothetical protein